MTKPRHFVFAGGGSGGHLTPAIAVAEQLLAEDSDCRVTFVTSGRNIDATVMQHASVSRSERCLIVPLPVTQPPGFRPSGWRHLISLGMAIQQCRRLFKKQHVDVVMATGAFASVPGLLTARWLDIPTVLFEANAVPGRVNRWWSRRAALRLTGFPGGAGKEVSDFEYTGMPLTGKSVLCEPDNTNCRKQILIVGGSQGSQRLNALVVQALSATQLPEGWKVLHQTGPNPGAMLTSDSLEGCVATKEFVPDLMDQMSESAFVISRAGAVTLAEMSATGCPAILIPLSTAADDHQRSNAEHLVDNGAAVFIDETESQAVDELRGVLDHLMTDVSARSSMSNAMRLLHQEGAALNIARRLVHLVDSRAAKSGP